MKEQSLDRFASGLPDRQDEAPWGYCELSDVNIYIGEHYLESPEGEIILNDFETLIEHTNYKRKTAGEED